jgi:hypothetical protein
VRARIGGFAAALVSSGLAFHAYAQDAGSAADIVVTATRLQQQAEDFVGAIAQAPPSEDQLARWDSRICVGAVGLEADAAQALVDRISGRARAVGLRPGEPGCRANVMVIYAPDSDTLTRQIVDRRRDLLGYNGDEGVVTAGREALEAFASTPRAVRWWHVAQTTDADGGAIGNAETSDGPGNTVGDNSLGSADGAGSTTQDLATASMGTGSFQGLEGVRSSGSRMRRSTRQDLNYVLIVVDAQRVNGIPAAAWMDYVAFVALAQINPDAAPRSFPTILNLFSSPQSAPASMSDWDVAYLDALYRATRTAPNSRRQRSEMARTIADRINVQQ